MAPLIFLFDTHVSTGTGGGMNKYEVTFVPHALAILCAGVYLGLLALVCWWELRKCKCGRGPE